MRFRVVELSLDRKVDIAVYDIESERWIPILTAIEALERIPEFGDLCRSLVGLKEPLEGGVLALLIAYDVDSHVGELLLELVRCVVMSDEPSLSFEAVVKLNANPILPFHPLSLRDGMLWDEHAVRASKGILSRYVGLPFRLLVSLYEGLTGELFPRRRYQTDFPRFYNGNAINVIGHGDVLTVPHYVVDLDYELEIAGVIGKTVRNCGAVDGWEAIVGFFLLNDFSARKALFTRDELSLFGMKKTKGFGNAVGAVVVTRDEFETYLPKLRAEVRINGKVIVSNMDEQRSPPFAQPYFSMGELVAYISEGLTVVPGEVVAFGTLPGCCALENGRFLKPGEKITLRMEPLGELTNVVSPVREEYELDKWKLKSSVPRRAPFSDARPSWVMRGVFFAVLVILLWWFVFK